MTASKGTLSRAAAVVLACASATLATAEPELSDAGAEALAKCQNEELANAERIASCSGLIGASSQPDVIRAEAFLNRGLVAADQGDHEKAIADFTQAIGLNATYPAPYRNRALAYAAAGSKEKAIADFSALLKLEADDVEALFLRGALQLQANRPELALADFTRVIALDPTDADAHVGCGEAELALADAKKAADHFNQALALEPDNEAAKAGLQRLGVAL